jgi:hypothetical protein
VCVCVAQTQRMNSNKQDLCVHVGSGAHLQQPRHFRAVRVGLLIAPDGGLGLARRLEVSRPHVMGRLEVDPILLLRHFDGALPLPARLGV